ncbi:MAG TPA: hypothetical protein VF491_17710 [Vicinamibacterales bacterium]
MALNLPTMDEVNAKPHATPKHQMTPDVLAKEERRKSKKQNAETFRAAVWARDHGRCRATGVTLSKAGTDPHSVGEVDHSIPRSLAPERIYDVTNGVLLSRFLNRLRKVACAEAPEHRMFDYSGPDDRSQPQKFTWRDRTGKVVKEHIG